MNFEIKVKGVKSMIIIDSTNPKWNLLSSPKYTRPAYTYRLFKANGESTCDLSVLLTSNDKLLLYRYSKGFESSVYEGVHPGLYAAVEARVGSVPTIKVGETISKQVEEPTHNHQLLHCPNSIPESVVADFKKRGVPLRLLVELGYYLIEKRLYTPAYNIETGELCPFVCRDPGNEKYHKRTLRGSKFASFAWIKSSVDECETLIVCEGIMTALAIANYFPNQHVVSVGAHNNYPNLINDTALSRYFPEVTTVVIVPDVDSNHHSTDSISKLTINPEKVRLAIFPMNPSTLKGDFGDLKSKTAQRVAAALFEFIAFASGKNLANRLYYERKVTPCTLNNNPGDLPMIQGSKTTSFLEPMGFLNNFLRLGPKSFYCVPHQLVVSLEQLTSLIESPATMIPYTSALTDLMGNEPKGSVVYKEAQAVLDKIKRWSTDTLISNIPNHPLLRLDMYGFAFKNGYFMHDGSNHWFVTDNKTRPAAVNLRYPPIHLEYVPEAIDDIAKKEVEFVLGHCMCGGSRKSKESVARMLRSLFFGNEDHIATHARSIYVVEGTGGIGKSQLGLLIKSMDPYAGDINPMSVASKNKSQFHFTHEDALKSIKILDDAPPIFGDVSFLKTSATGGEMRTEGKFQNPVYVETCASMVFVYNETPKFDNDTGLERRLRYVTLEGKRNNSIKVDTLGTLSKHLPAVFNWICENINTVLSDEDFYRSTKTEVPADVMAFAEAVFTPSFNSNPALSTSELMFFKRVFIQDENECKKLKPKERTTLWQNTNRKQEPQYSLFDGYKRTLGLKNNISHSQFEDKLRIALSYRQVQQQFLGVEPTQSLYNYRELFFTVNSKTQYVRMRLEQIHENPDDQDPVTPPPEKQNKDVALVNQVSPVPQKTVIDGYFPGEDSFLDIVWHLQNFKEWERSEDLLWIVYNPNKDKEFEGFLKTNYHGDELTNLLRLLRMYREPLVAVKSNNFLSPELHTAVLDDFEFATLTDMFPEKLSELSDLKEKVLKANLLYDRCYAHSDVSMLSLINDADKAAARELSNYITPPHKRAKFILFLDSLKLDTSPTFEELPTDGEHMTVLKLYAPYVPNTEEYLISQGRKVDNLARQRIDDVEGVVCLKPTGESRINFDEVPTRVTKGLTGVAPNRAIHGIIEDCILPQPKDITLMYLSGEYPTDTNAYPEIPGNCPNPSSIPYMRGPRPIGDICEAVGDEYQPEQSDRFFDPIKEHVPYMKAAYLEAKTLTNTIENPGKSAIAKMAISEPACYHGLSWMHHNDRIREHMISLAAPFITAREAYNRGEYDHPFLVDYVYPYGELTDSLAEGLLQKEGEESVGQLMDILTGFNQAQAMANKLESEPQRFEKVVSDLKAKDYFWKRANFISGTGRRFRIINHVKYLEGDQNK